jgi:pimeloyl-ACP methyl ester carboxylesterase
VPDLRFKRIPEGSHWVIHEQPWQVSSAIREFLAEG